MRSGGAVVAALCVAAVVGASARAAGPGSLDTTFGGVSNGLSSHDFPTDACPGLDHASAIAVQPNGKIVVAGFGERDDASPCGGGIYNDFVIERLTANGTLDTTFGDQASVGRTGWTTVDIRGVGYDDQAYAVGIQSDGKIVVVGHAGGPSSPPEATNNFGIARFNADGTLDTSFAAGPGCAPGGITPGATTTYVGGEFNSARAVGFQSDGKIVVAGYRLTSTSNFDFVVVRYKTDGCIDTSFATNGIFVKGLAGNGNDFAAALLIEANDAIVVGGRVDNGTVDYDNGFGLMRLTAAGALDASFGTNGIAFTSFGNAGSNVPDGVNALAQQTDGKIVAAGLAYQGTTRGVDFALARYSSSGTLDTSFGSNGTVTTDFGPGVPEILPPNDNAFGVAIQTGGSIVAGGYASDDSGYDFALARYNPDGSLDPAFGSGGKVETNVSAIDGSPSSTAVDMINAVAVSGGNILAAGWDTLFPGTSSQTNDFVVARYLGGAAGDGLGTMTVNPNKVRSNTTGNTLTFTYTAPASGLSNGAVSLAVPAGWSAPSKNDSTAPGYVTANYGLLGVSGSTITVSYLNLGAGAKLKIVYGSKVSGGPGASSPPTGNVQTWLTKEKSTATGTLTTLSAGSPSVDVLAPDGSGTMTVSPTKVSSASTGNTLTFTYTASAGGLSGGRLTLTAPNGWSAPSVNGTSPGYFTSSTGTRSASGQTMTISNLTLAGGAKLTIVYGSKAGGGPGATAPATGAVQTWFAKQQSSTLSGAVLTALAASPAVDVLAADGTGTMIASRTSVVHSSTGNTILFTYTAAAGGISNGAVTLTVPAGWSAPSTTGTAGGYVTASTGARSVSGQMIIVTGVTLAGGAQLTMTYGSKAGGGPGATAPGATGAQTWTTKERSSSLGTLAALASPPVISVT